MPGQLGLEGLHRVRMQELAPGQPIIVASFDDRFNMVGGLTFKQRMDMLRGIEAALSQSGSGPGRPAGEEQYALWVALEVTHRLMAAKSLRWTSTTGKHGHRLRPGYCVLNLLPDATRRLDVPGARIGRLVNAMRARLERDVFGAGVFASNHDLQAAALHALIPDNQEALITPRRLVSLPNGRGSFSHMSLTQVLRYYGLGRGAKVGGQRGYNIAHWHLRQLVSLVSETASLDLRALPWRHGAYKLAGAQA